MAQWKEKPRCQFPGCHNAVPAMANKFCSRDCWHASRRAAWPICQREGCTNQVNRKVGIYCSHTCHTLAQCGSLLPTCKAPGCTNHVERRGRLHCSLKCASPYVSERRKLAMYKNRRKRFGRVLDEMARQSHRLTREQIVDMLARAYDEGYSAGYCARLRQIRRAA
jgi:hypothetical protein